MSPQPEERFTLFYEDWPLNRFRSEMERLMEAEHMAPDHEGYMAYHAALVVIKQEFVRLHPRAYKNWLEHHEFRSAIERIK